MSILDVSESRTKHFLTVWNPEFEQETIIQHLRIINDKTKNVCKEWGHSL